eukprot:753680-Hanusia_phi.AAC.3
MAERYFRQAFMCGSQDARIMLEYGMYLLDAKFDYKTAQVMRVAVIWMLSFPDDVNSMFLCTQKVFVDVLEKYPKTGYAMTG